jgi:hypothetical protein
MSIVKSYNVFILYKVIIRSLSIYYLSLYLLSNIRNILL